MEKYLGNKKSILNGIEEFMLKKGIGNGILFDAFTGTTNVAQYFKQRGFQIISNDINPFCYVLQDTYIASNTFPKFSKLISYLQETEGSLSNSDQLKDMHEYSVKKIINDKIFMMDYEQKTQYVNNILPLYQVINYLNRLQCLNLNEDEMFFYNYYCSEGDKSEYTSLRGTTGKRNYFSEGNAKKIGIILVNLKKWYSKMLISERELNILLTAVIEEVTLVANVNGTFHDFNRKKLYPNAIVDMMLKPPILNINPALSEKNYHVFCCDSNVIHNEAKFKSLNESIDILYIDPPYNFRQYSAYYHLLNLIAKFHTIGDLKEYAQQIKFVRGQNPADNFDSEYCYKDKFASALKDLIRNIKAKHVIISYYDENNHWSHGKSGATFEGRKVILNILSDTDLFESFDKEPYTISRLNYQSQSGLKKKNINELLFYGRRR